MLTSGKNPFGDTPDWEKAIRMFADCVRLLPDNLVYRQNLRGCERKRYQDDKNNVPSSSAEIDDLRSRIQLAREDRNWIAMDRAAEEGLQLNPWNGEFNAAVGDAARERGFLEVAQFAYETAVRHDIEPDSKQFLISLASIYEQQHKIDLAVATLQRVLQQDPLNVELRSKIQTLELTGLFVYDNSVQSTQRAKVDDPFADTSEEFEDLSRRVQDDPSDLKLKFELAKLLMKSKMFDEAIPLLLDASKDNRIQGVVLVSLGMCFLAKKQQDLAKRQFEKAIEILSEDDNRQNWSFSNN